MKVIRREWFGTSRSEVWTLYPLGDIHLGNAACDEKLFSSVVRRIAQDDHALWLGMGDYCEFINLNDPRFDAESLADWVKVSHLGDLARAQADRFLSLVEPIADKCLGLIEGNHERAIFKHFERSIYSDIVTGIKRRAGQDVDSPLAFGYSGWLVLVFYRMADRHAGNTLKVNLHHGFVGGKLAGAKALNMQRWLWTHEADLVIFGHSHNSGAQIEAVEQVRGSKVVQQHRIGMFTGTFATGMRYAEEKGYFPTPISFPLVRLQPGAKVQRDRVRVITG